jgi:hypothetical protein
MHITEAIQDAARRRCDVELTDHQAYVVFRAMGQHKSIKFRDYAALDQLLASDPAGFDELVRKTTGVMRHYDFSLKVFDMALRYHDPQRRVPA